MGSAGRPSRLGEAALMTDLMLGDCAKPTSYPDAWRIRELTLAVLPVGAVKLAYAMTILALGCPPASGSWLRSTGPAPASAWSLMRSRLRC